MREKKWKTKKMLKTWTKVQTKKQNKNKIIILITVKTIKIIKLFREKNSEKH